MHETDIRDTFIARVVNGHDFVDVGGLYGVVSEKLSIAHKSGAREVTIFDRAPHDDPDWAKLDQHLSAQDIPYHTILGDLLYYTSRPFEVVHSSGMLYHSVNPLEYLKRLRTMTQKHAIITTAITQEVISNSYGEYRIPPSGVIFMLSLNDQERAVLAEYWRPWGVVSGVTEPRAFEIESGGWLWLPTATAFKSMVEACRFKILDEGPYWFGNAYTVLVE